MYQNSIASRRASLRILPQIALTAIECSKANQTACVDRQGQGLRTVEESHILVGLRIHTQVYTHIHTLTHTHIFTHTFTQSYTHIHTHIFTHTFIYIFTHSFTGTHSHARDLHIYLPQYSSHTEIRGTCSDR